MGNNGKSGTRFDRTDNESDEIFSLFCNKEMRTKRSQ